VDLKSKNRKKPTQILFRAHILYGFLFNSEDISEIFLCKVGSLSVDYAALYPRGPDVQ
jgi:hypothetical protein